MRITVLRQEIYEHQGTRFRLYLRRTRRSICSFWSVRLKTYDIPINRSYSHRETASSTVAPRASYRLGKYFHGDRRAVEFHDRKWPSDRSSPILFILNPPPSSIRHTHLNWSSLLQNNFDLYGLYISDMYLLIFCKTLICWFVIFTRYFMHSVYTLTGEQVCNLYDPL